MRELEDVLRAASSATSETLTALTALYTVGELARHVGVIPATLRGWEEASILRPRRHQNGHREYPRDDVLEARVAVLLRRGDFPLASIAAAISEIRRRGDVTTALAQLREWRQNLDARSRELVTASVHLNQCLPWAGELLHPPPASTDVPCQYT